MNAKEHSSAAACFTVRMTYLLLGLACFAGLPTAVSLGTGNSISHNYYYD